ncbi:copper chaperone PCu(A)C [Acetobacter sp. LMG 32666]|uniref:copper chaperone PCu(A)C n=1 Tax=Acetobacter sp. LMG 32666 TaxID=2959295 RepID=UPI0030C8CF4E
MKPRYQAILASALLSLTALSPVHAQEHNTGPSVPGQADAQKDITITDSALHFPTTPGQGQAELYFTLTNNSHTTHLLTGVTSPACSKLIGYHTDQENTPGTRHLFQHLALPETTTLVFASAGYHMLCVGPVAQALGQSNVQVTFQFLGGSSKSVSTPITSAAQ